tara:strand:- start:1124 stop:1306 length:183 start_codon:yes stop_codon:yes gene_type:complete
MGLGSLILQAIFIGYLFGCVYAFYYGWTHTITKNQGPNNKSDSSEENFFYAAMWQDMNSD